MSDPSVRRPVHLPRTLYYRIRPTVGARAPALAAALAALAAAPPPRIEIAAGAGVADRALTIAGGAGGDDRFARLSPPAMPIFDARVEAFPAARSGGPAARLGLAARVTLGTPSRRFAGDVEIPSRYLSLSATARYAAPLVAGRLEVLPALGAALHRVGQRGVAAEMLGVGAVFAYAAARAEIALRVHATSRAPAALRFDAAVHYDLVLGTGARDGGPLGGNAAAVYGGAGATPVASAIGVRAGASLLFGGAVRAGVEAFLMRHATAFRGAAPGVDGLVDARASEIAGGALLFVSAVGL